MRSLALLGCILLASCAHTVLKPGQQVDSVVQGKIVSSELIPRPLAGAQITAMLNGKKVAEVEAGDGGLFSLDLKDAVPPGTGGSGVVQEETKPVKVELVAVCPGYQETKTAVELPHVTDAKPVTIQMLTAMGLP